MKKIVIAAANGFIGQHLVNHFSKDHEVIGLVRRPMKGGENMRYVLWDGKNLDEWQSELEGAEVVINLAGKSINCRHTDENKKGILQSRIESTQAIGQAIDLCKTKPKIWMNASGASIYAYDENKPNSEQDTDFADSFIAHVSKEWEDAFYAFTYSDLRQVALRTTVVLGKEDGAFPVMNRLAKLWLGGKQGSGKQMMSWIHIDDYVSAIDHIIGTEVNGNVNLGAPNPLSNADFMGALRKANGRSFGFPTPEFALKIGARFLNTEPSLVLDGMNVVPKVLLDSNFNFQFPSIEKALENLTK
ncbi:MAG: TIGR01777 family oxidoreductase [Crocinitomicaceae bacterium]|nr:TIGR01777 family oxidoreductase [Crocinitomicaceae bacterium]